MTKKLCNLPSFFSTGLFQRIVLITQSLQPKDITEDTVITEEMMIKYIYKYIYIILLK